MLYTPDGQVWASEVRQEELRRKRAKRNAGSGVNLTRALQGLDEPCPWEAELRAFSPIYDHVSHLRPYFYHAGQRWVLYECIPLHLMPSDDRKVRPDLTGAELHFYLNGKPPRDRSEDDPSPISDVQHEMARRWKVWAGPLWVMQGNGGGHLWRLDPQMQAMLTEMGCPTEMPPIGAFPPCPFDERTKQALYARNRLAQLGGSLDKLQRSGSPEMRAAEEARLQREVREASMKFIEGMLEPLVDMATSLVAGPNTRSEHMDQLVPVHGQAGRMADAYEQYRETGDYTTKVQ